MTDEIDEFLTVAEIAKLTHTSAAVWRKRIWRRAICFIKLGRSVRVRREDLDRWIADRVVPAAPPAEKVREGR